MQNFGKILIIFGIISLTLGVIFFFFPNINWSKLPIGRLPGDIYIKKEGMSFYLPLTSGILISVIISFIIYFFKK